MFAYRQTSSFNTKFCNKLFPQKKENRLNFLILMLADFNQFADISKWLADFSKCYLARNPTQYRLFSETSKE